MKCRRFTQIRVPTEANAAESNLDPQDYVQRMNKAYDIDYEAVHIACKRETERFAGVKQVAVHTGADCMLYLDLTGRVWHIDAGDGDLPCGEICIAPVENKTNGKEVSTNNCCKFMAIFIIFSGFCLKQLQQLFSDNS